MSSPVWPNWGLTDALPDRSDADQAVPGAHAQDHTDERRNLSALLRDLRIARLIPLAGGGADQGSITALLQLIWDLLGSGVGGGRAQHLGALTIHGHSWAASPNWNGNEMPNYDQQGVAARLAGMLNIDRENLTDLAVAGSRAAWNHWGLGPIGADHVSGWSAVCQLIVPNNSSIAGPPGIAGVGGGLVTDLSAPPPGGFVWIHGVNDVQTSSFDFGSLGRLGAAYGHAVRHWIARCRAGVLWGSTATGASGAYTAVWDAAIQFPTGTWVDTNTLQGGTGASQKVTSGPGVATATFQFPRAVPASFYCDVEFISTPGATCVLGINIASSSPGTSQSWVGVTDTNTAFPQSGGFTVQVGSERVLVTATTGGSTPTWTVTRGQGGTTAAAHITSDIVFRAQMTDVAFSVNGDGKLGGTTLTSAASISTQGQGLSSAPPSQVPVVKRFLCSSADSNKILTITTQNLFGSLDKVTISSVFFESISPPPCAILNVPRGITHPFYTNGVAPFLNSAVTSVIAEFPADGTIQVADFDALTFNRSAALVSDGGGATITVTANGTSFPGTTATNFKIQIEDERILVGTVTGSYPNFTLNGCVRGRDGTGPVTHTATTSGGIAPIVVPADIWAEDGLHPNDAGAAAVAQLLYDAFGRATLATNAIAPGQALAASSWVQDRRASRPSIGNGYVIKPRYTGAAVSAQVPLNRWIGELIYIDKPGIITSMQVWEDTGTAPTTIRFGLVDLDTSGGRPGTLICEYGTIAGASNSLRQCVGHRRVWPGLYVATVVMQGGGTAGAAPFACIPSGGSLDSFPDTGNLSGIGELPIAGVFASTPSFAAGSRDGANLVTLTGVSTTAGIVVGSHIYVSAVDTTYNGTWVVASVSGSTITYTQTGGPGADPSSSFGIINIPGDALPSSFAAPPGILHGGTAEPVPIIALGFATTNWL